MLVFSMPGGGYIMYTDSGHCYVYMYKVSINFFPSSLRSIPPSLPPSLPHPPPLHRLPMLSTRYKKLTKYLINRAAKEWVIKDSPVHNR